MVDFSCHKCNKKFKSQYHLDRHLNRKNSCDKNSIFICDICKKEFTLKFNYERHLKRKMPCTQNSNEGSTQSENQIRLEIEREKTERLKIEASIELEKLKFKAELDLKMEREKSKIRIEEERERTKEKIRLKQVEEKKILYIKCENDTDLLINKINNNNFFNSINSIEKLEPPSEETVMEIFKIKDPSDAYYSLLENVYVHNEKNRCIIPIIENETNIKLIIKKNNTWYIEEYKSEFSDIKRYAEESYESILDRIDAEKNSKLIQDFIKILHTKRINEKIVVNIIKPNKIFTIQAIIDKDYILNLTE